MTGKLRTRHFEQVSTVLFLLGSYEYLIKAGRMPRLAGALAARLNIRMLGCASEAGIIKVTGATRTEKHLIQRVVDFMAAHGHHGGLVYIDHVENHACAQRVAAAAERGRGRSAGAEIVSCEHSCGSACQLSHGKRADSRDETFIKLLYIRHIMKN